MDSRKLNDWLQIVGLFSVLGGLIFVGLQLRQDSQIALSEGIQSAAGAQKEWAALVTANSEVWTKGLAGGVLMTNEISEFEALAMAYHIDHYTRWTRADTVTGTDPTRFIREYATELNDNPGLRAWFDDRIEALNNLGVRNTWDLAAEAEVRRLAGEDGETQ